MRLLTHCCLPRVHLGGDTILRPPNHAPLVALDELQHFRQRRLVSPLAADHLRHMTIRPAVLRRPIALQDSGRRQCRLPLTDAAFVRALTRRTHGVYFARGRGSVLRKRLTWTSSKLGNLVRQVGSSTFHHFSLIRHLHFIQTTAQAVRATARNRPPSPVLTTPDACRSPLTLVTSICPCSGAGIKLSAERSSRCVAGLCSSASSVPCPSELRSGHREPVQQQRTVLQGRVACQQSADWWCSSMRHPVIRVARAECNTGNGVQARQNATKLGRLGQVL